LTATYFSKFTAAIAANKEDFEKELPDHVSKEVAERLLKFVAVKEKDQIISKCETHISELTEDITAKTKVRDELKPPAKKSESKPKAKAQKKKKVVKQNSDSSSDEAPLEDRLRNVLKEVSRRSDAVHLTKDDFESFSEAQSQLDSLMKETMTEIMRMKQNLRKKFARVQSRRGGSSGRRSRKVVQA